MIRKVYINSTDRTNTDEVTGALCDFDLSTSRIECGANEDLRVAVSHASFPAGSMGLTQATTTRRLADSPDCAVLHIFYNEFTGPATQVQNYYIYLNDISGTATNPEGVTSTTFTQRTTIDELLTVINAALGSEIVIRTEGETGQYRLKMVPSTLYDSFYFFADSTPAILRALGLKTESDTGITTTVQSPFDICIANACPMLYICTNLNTNTFSSSNALNNILCSVPVHATPSPQTVFVDVSEVSGGVSTLTRSMSFNYEPFIHSGNYKRIGDKNIDELRVRVVNSVGYPLLMNTGIFSLVLDVQVSGNE